MTRAEIVSYTTGKLGITDAAAQAKAEEFCKARWRMLWNKALWRQARYVETVAVAAATETVTLGATCEFVLAARWAEAYEILSINELTALAINPSGFDVNGAFSFFSPIGKDSSGNAQIRLVSKPTEAKNLLIFGKRKCLELTNGTDSPLIPGASEALCEYVMGDLYDWLRQLTKAQVFFDRAAKLLADMMEIETAQTSEVRRIIPQVQTLDGEDSSSGGSWMQG